MRKEGSQAGIWALVGSSSTRFHPTAAGHDKATLGSSLGLPHTVHNSLVGADCLRHLTRGQTPQQHEMCLAWVLWQSSRYHAICMC